MKVAIYTLTRDRLDYSKACFARLHEMAGYPFDHYVVDNGSQDGTVDWLLSQQREDRLQILATYKENKGISVGSNRALASILTKQYDLIIKFDNDCWIETPDLLAEIVSIFRAIKRKDPPWILSPRVGGLVKQPPRSGKREIIGHRVGQVGIVGGIFHCVPRRVYSMYRYPETLPLAWGQDDHFCHWALMQGVRLGYLEDLLVLHHETTTGQQERYPEYFERKWKEEKHAKTTKEETSPEAQDPGGKPD